MQTQRLLVGLFSLISLLFTGALQAQEETLELPRSSPRGEVKQRVATTDIELSYSRPSTRGRTIFGALVPMGEVWRTGADSATTISFSTPVLIAGQSLAAGTYELFTIPGEQKWTVIFHENKSQWGSYAYDAENDVIRVDVKPHLLAQPAETLTLSIDDLTANSATLNIAWERFRVPVDITIDVRETILPKLEAALAGENPPTFQAAMFYFENDLDIERAAELMGEAVESRPESFPLIYRYALILEQKGDHAGAKAAAEKSLEIAKGVEGRELRDEYIRLNTTVLERLKSSE